MAQRGPLQSLVPSVLGLVRRRRPRRRRPTSAAIAAEVAAAGRTPVHLPASPLMHGTGFMSSLQALYVGGTIVTLESRSFDAHELWRAVEREHVTQMAIVGDAFGKPMVRALEEAEADSAPYDLSSLGLVISSGVMWTAEVKEALMARGAFLCLDSLGSSEGVGFAQQISAPGRRGDDGEVPIGAHTKVLTEDGREVEPGSDEIGLLALGGPIPLGYYKDPEKIGGARSATFGDKRYSIPGDWAKVAADGTIELLGRGSVSINSGGEKIFPEEVEEAVKKHPAVVDAIVVGVPDEQFGEAITAVVSFRPGESATADEIVDHGQGEPLGVQAPAPRGRRRRGDPRPERQGRLRLGEEDRRRARRREGAPARRRSRSSPRSPWRAPRAPTRSPRRRRGHDVDPTGRHRHAVRRDPRRRISGPLTGGNGINLASAQHHAARCPTSGWVEAEYPASGTATSYRSAGPLPTDGRFRLTRGTDGRRTAPASWCAGPAGPPRSTAR